MANLFLLLYGFLLGFGFAFLLVIALRPEGVNAEHHLRAALGMNPLRRKDTP